MTAWRWGEGGLVAARPQSHGAKAGRASRAAVRRAEVRAVFPWTRTSAAGPIFHPSAPLPQGGVAPQHHRNSCPDDVGSAIGSW